MASRIKVVFLLFSKKVLPKSKTLVNFESLSCSIDMPISIIVFRRAQSFFRIFGPVDQIVRTSFNFTFSTTGEGVKRILKTVFELVFSKMT